jgi:Flp pilus assembly pilin Flp
MKIVKNESGASLIEYSLVFGMVTLIAIMVLLGVGQQVSTTLCHVEGGFPGNTSSCATSSVSPNAVSSTTTQSDNSTTSNSDSNPNSTYDQGHNDEENGDDNPCQGM